MLLTIVAVVAITYSVIRIFHYGTRCSAEIKTMQDLETIGDLDNIEFRQNQLPQKIR